MTEPYEGHVKTLALALAEIGQTLEHVDHVEERIDRALRLTADVVPCSRCSLLFVLGGQRRLIASPAPALADRTRLVEALERIFRFIVEGEEIGGADSAGIHLTLPVVGLDEVLGVLRVEHEPNFAYDATHLRLLSVIAAQLGGYVTMLRLREEQSRHAEELRAANEFQQLLVGVVGHDLRSPLSVIMTVASLLLARTKDEDQIRKLERALSNAKLAARIIDDLVDVTRARVTHTLPVEKRSVDLRVVIELIVADARLAHPGRTIELRFDESESTLGHWDADRLSQIVTNLINNAMQHGARDQPVSIRVDLDESSAQLAVHNGGKAIAAELLPALFDPFRQGSRQRSHRGLGLGLYIVDQAARAHGGSVAVESGEGIGTTFTVTLPRWDAELESGDAEGRPASPHRATVMVVDDDEDVCRATRTLLEREGYAVIKASNGREALDILRAGSRPDVILLDLWMPVMDGEAFRTACHADPALAGIPIVVLTADADRALKMSQQGSVELLSKPITPDRLLDIVSQWTAGGVGETPMAPRR